MTFAYRRTQRLVPKKPAPVDPVTQRIRQVERMLAQGMAVEDIAEAAGLKANVLASFMRRHGLRKP